MIEAAISNITFNNGKTIPQLGFGTLSIQPDRQDTVANTEITARIVGEALQIGYRHIDTAQHYGTERGVGQAIVAFGLPRDEVFVTTKLGNANHRPHDVRRSFDETLEKLRLQQVDLFLMHWPLPTLYSGDYVSTWRAMTELVSDGRVRSAGVSNFQPDHLDRIIHETGVVPVVNQIEVHPEFSNSVAVEATRRYGIAVEAWSPLGQGKVLRNPVIARIAAERGKSPAQIVLRWHIHHGYVIFPKSTHRGRMQENFRLFDFELSAAEIVAIDALDKGESGRIGPNPDTFAWIP
jgi:2,5-diketo-D-gluconate reductase A